MTPRQTPGMQLCKWCGATLSPHQAVTTKSCGAQECERQRTVALSRAVADRRAQEHQDLKDALANEHADQIAALLSLHGLETGDVRIAMTPYNAGELSVLSDQRRADLEAHLAMVAAEGFAIEDPESLSWPAQRRSAILPEPAVADAACATCQGGCCRPGGPSWGFIGKEEVCRYRIANPNAGAEDFQQYYLDHLPEQSVTDSCVFQSNTGCTLSRVDRSTLCNTFLCRGVKTMLTEREAGGEVSTIFIAQENGTAFNVGVFDPERGFLSTERIASDRATQHDNAAD